MSHCAHLLLTAAFSVSSALWASCITEASTACTLIGCDNGYYLTTAVDLPFDDLQRATYHSCRNDECHSLQLEVAEPGKSAETYLLLGSGRDLNSHLIVAVVATDAPGKTELRLEWIFAERPLVDRASDEYEVKIEADGQELYSTKKLVTKYNASQPNGPVCEPTCYHASSSD